MHSRRRAWDLLTISWVGQGISSPDGPTVGYHKLRPITYAPFSKPLFGCPGFRIRKRVTRPGGCAIGARQRAMMPFGAAIAVQVLDQRPKNMETVANAIKSAIYS